MTLGHSWILKLPERGLKKIQISSFTTGDSIGSCGWDWGICIIPNNDKTHKNQRHNSDATSGTKTKAIRIYSLMKKMAKETEYNFTT